MMVSILSIEYCNYYLVSRTAQKLEWLWYFMIEKYG